MTSKGKSKQEEALQFLDDLDSFAPHPGVAVPGSNSVGATAAPPNEGEAEVLAFLDEITQKSTEPTRPAASHLDRPTSRSGTPTFRKTTERVKLAGSSLLPSASSSTASLPRTSTISTEKANIESVATTGGGGSWGWGSVWSTASAALQQAKSAVDEQVKALPKNEQARKWGEGVIEYAKSAQLDKLGQDFKRVGLSTLTDILNVVAPPISEHEVIQVWLSHDMQGYDGIESLVYRALTRILEQVEGGDLIVNRGNESRPKDGVDGRNLNTVDGHEAAFKLAQANINEVIKSSNKVTLTKPSSTQSPTTYSHVYLRVQPFFTTHSHSTLPPSDLTSKLSTATQHLQFLIYLSDPTHQLTHTTITQAVPGKWLAMWDEYEWVEDLVAEALRVGVEVIGQEYVVARMGWGKDKEQGHTESEGQNAATGEVENENGEDL